MVLYDAAYAKHNDGFANRLARGLEKRYVAKAFRPNAGEILLEVGSNGGVFGSWLEERYGVHVIGMDINEEAADASLLDNLLVGSAEALDLDDSSVDGVVSRHTIEHLNDPEQAIGEMYRVTRNGGRIVLTYPFEIIRGMTAIPSAYRLHGDIRKARAMHLHKLFPRDVENMLNTHSSIPPAQSSLIWVPIPVWLTKKIVQK